MTGPRSIPNGEATGILLIATVLAVTAAWVLVIGTAAYRLVSWLRRMS